MPGQDIPSLLEAWRLAERQWERPASPAEVRTAAMAVVAAYVAYQEASLPKDSREFLLIADDDQTLVAASSGITAILHYQPDEVIGRTIAGLAGEEDVASTPAQWLSFVTAGRQDGSFRLRDRDGHSVALRYQARAHHPVPGFHLSRLWPADDDAAPSTQGRDAAASRRPGTPAS
jgi:PAS domain-containing protein